MKRRLKMANDDSDDESANDRRMLTECQRVNEDENKQCEQSMRATVCSTGNRQVIEDDL